MGRPTKAEILEQKEKAIKEIEEMTINRACEILNNKGCYIIVADEYNRTMREYQKMKTFLDALYPQFKVYIQTDTSGTSYRFSCDAIEGKEIDKYSFELLKQYLDDGGNLIPLRTFLGETK